MADRQSRREQVAVKVGERFLLVQAEEIIYASLADESINIVTGQVAGTSNYRTLDELQARLDPDVFWRVHRSHLVNINKIKEIVPWFSRNYILRMKDAKGTEIPVSRVADQAAPGVSEALDAVQPIDDHALIDPPSRRRRPRGDRLEVDGRSRAGTSLVSRAASACVRRTSSSPGSRRCSRPPSTPR